MALIFQQVIIIPACCASLGLVIWCSPLDQQILAMSWSFCWGSFEENLSLAFPEFHFPQSKKVYVLSGKVTGSHHGADGSLVAGLAPAFCERCAGATLQRSGMVRRFMSLFQ